MAEVPQSVWEEKDRRIVKQSMLKAAVEFHSKQLENGQISSPQTVIGTANIFVDWVYNGDSNSNPVSVGSTVSDIGGPTPTLAQAQALEKVEKETGWTASQVFAQFAKYPTPANVDQCIARINSLEK